MIVGRSPTPLELDVDWLVEEVIAVTPMTTILEVSPSRSVIASVEVKGMAVVTNDVLGSVGSTTTTVETWPLGRVVGRVSV